MHDRRPPPREPPKRKPPAEVAREFRVRRKQHVLVFPGRLGPGALNAMIARNRFKGMDKREAEAKARDPEEISRIVFDVMERVWAREWFALMKKK